MDASFLTRVVSKQNFNGWRNYASRTHANAHGAWITRRYRNGISAICYSHSDAQQGLPSREIPAWVERVRPVVAAVAD